MSASPRLRHLALHDLHGAAGAAFAEHGGWSLPEHYGSWLAEHAAIREGVAVLDRSHRSRFMVTGTDAVEVLRACFAGHLADLEEGRATRAVALDDHGRIGDLVLVARTGGIAYLVSGEPGQRTETFVRLQEAVGEELEAHVEDRTETTCLLALTGPRSAQIAASHLSEALPGRVPPLHCVTFEFHGFRMLATRSSDTGEDGFEFVVAPAVGRHLVERLQAAGVPLAGHAAFETARIEACIPAFDPDLLPGLTPQEAGLATPLGVSVRPGSRLLVALLLAGHAARVGAPLRREGKVVGEVRSSTRSPVVGEAIGLGMVDATVAAPGTALDADEFSATIVAKPFHRGRS